MNYYAFSGFFTFIVALSCGLVVLWKNPRGEKNKSLQPVALSMALWGFFYALWQLSKTPEQALLFIRISIVFAALIPVTNFHVILKLLDAETPWRNRFQAVFLSVTFLIVLSSPTPYFIPRVEQKLDFPFWPVPGPMVAIHFINLFIPSLWTLYLIWEKGLQSSPLARNRLKWLFIGLLIGYTGGITNNFLWYDIPIKPYLTILSPFGMVVIAALFFRLAIVDFNYLLKKSAVFVVSFLVSIGIISPLLFLFTTLHPFILITLSFLLGLLVYNLVLRGLSELTRRWGWFGDTTVQAKREKLKEATYTYNDLAHNLVDLVMGSFRIDCAAVYFYDLNKKEYYLCSQNGMKSPLTQNLRYNRSALALNFSHPLISLLEKRKDIIHMEALLSEAEKTDLKGIIENMRQIEAEICAPFTFGDKLRGFLVMGRKKDNTLFNDAEMETILSFSTMATEVMRYIMAMETELHHTALYSHDMNHDIRSLAQTLEFLGSPMAENQPPEKVRKLLDQAKKVAERLYESFQLNRDRSSLIMKTIRGEYEKKPVNISDVIKLSAGKFALQAEEKKVEYSVDIDPQSCVVMGNDLDLTRVLDNLIANAFRYLPESGGRLEVGGHAMGHVYEIRVKDNGDGIEPENLKHIFDLGWQSPGDDKKGAAGYGLAIVKQVVQIHDGTIQVSSEGKGTGLQFQITLPLIPNP